MVIPALVQSIATLQLTGSKLIVLGQTIALASTLACAGRGSGGTNDADRRVHPTPTVAEEGSNQAPPVTRQGSSQAGQARPTPDAALDAQAPTELIAPPRTPHGSAPPNPDTTRHSSRANTPLADPRQWTKVYEWSGPDKRDWLFAVWVSPQGVIYLAGNRGIVRVEHDGTSETTRPVPYGAFMGLWGSSDTDVFAVHSKGAIARFDGHAWVVERQPGPDTSRSKELLHTVGPFLKGGGLVAFGPSLALKRGPDRTWVPLSTSEESELNGLWRRAPVGRDPCANSSAESYLRTTNGQAWIRCRDAAVYRVNEKGATFHGHVPHACDSVEEHLLFGDAMYVVCDETLFRNEGLAWETVSELRGIRDLAVAHIKLPGDPNARECIYALSHSALHRRCEDAARRTR